MKFFSLISTAAALTMLSASGFCEVQMSDLEPRVSDMEKTQTMSVEKQISYSSNGSSSQIRMDDHERRLQNLEYQKGSSGTGQGDVNALTSARGCRGENGPYFDLEFLWWRAVEDGLDYAWLNNASDSTIRANISVHGQDFEFDPGYRVGLGYNFDYDDWDLHAIYTWLYTYPKTSLTGTKIDGNGSVLGLLGILPINSGSLQFIGYERARNVSWQMQFNAWDLELGRNFYVGQYLALKPVAGIKGALIRQHIRANYDNSDDPRGGDDDPEFNNLQARGKTRWWGVGPKAGMHGDWELGAGFSIIGNIQAALLYGEFNTRFIINAIVDRTDDLGENEGGHFRDDFYRLRPMAALMLGLEWGRCFWDWMFFSMHVGWEAQYWWQQMEFINFKDITPDGDLSMTGVNAGIRFDF